MAIIFEDGVTDVDSNEYRLVSYFLQRVLTVQYAWTDSLRMRKLYSFLAIRHMCITRHVLDNG